MSLYHHRHKQKNKSTSRNIVIPSSSKDVKAMSKDGRLSYHHEITDFTCYKIKLVKEEFEPKVTYGTINLNELKSGHILKQNMCV